MPVQEEYQESWCNEFQLPFNYNSNEVGFLQTNSKFRQESEFWSQNLDLWAQTDHLDCLYLFYSFVVSSGSVNQQSWCVLW